MNEHDTVQWNHLIIPWPSYWNGTYLSYVSIFITFLWDFHKLLLEDGATIIVNTWLTLQLCTPLRLYHFRNNAKLNRPAEDKIVRITDNNVRTRSNKSCCLNYKMNSFLTKYSQKTTIARPSGRGSGCLMWIKYLIDILPQFQYTYVISWNIGPRYNGTRLYYDYITVARLCCSIHLIYKMHDIPIPFVLQRCLDETSIKSNYTFIPLSLASVLRYPFDIAVVTKH